MSVTRKMIEDWVCKKGWCDGSRDGEINNILAALDHFAPPIARMSVEEIEAAMDRAMQGVFIGSQLAPNGMAYNLSHARRRYAEEIHRLAQPVPKVDPDAEAKRLAWEWAKACGASSMYTSAENMWLSIAESQRNGWRAVAAAKKE
jgi:hypothetical protein